MARANLSVLLEGLRGKAGNVVFVKSREGTLVKPRVSPTNPNTKPQAEVRTALTNAAQAWTTLTAAQVKAWNEYAESKPHFDNATNKTTTPTGFNVFVKLTAKWFAVTGEETGFAVNPPTATFMGDDITVTANEESSPGNITFVASGENAEDITTELLLQRLPTSTRKPDKNGYRIAQYETFEGVSPEVEIPVSPGYYVAAYRFVNTVTGQMSALEYLPMMTVTMSLAKSKPRPTSPSSEKKKRAA